jgi:hypothetical protein
MRGGFAPLERKIRPGRRRSRQPDAGGAGRWGPAEQAGGDADAVREETAEAATFVAWRLSKIRRVVTTSTRGYI